jgi:hypothetical protein
MSGELDVNYLISAVHRGENQPQIEAVIQHKVEGERIHEPEQASRSKVIENINSNKVYYTVVQGQDSKWYLGDKVSKVTVEGQEYIRTDDKNSAGDNLGELPPV